MKFIDRVLAHIFSWPQVEQICPRCEAVIKTSPAIAKNIERHCCGECQKREREKLNRIVGTDD